MNNKNITRTAAIIYSEESSAIKSITVQRKIIEALFVENENKELNVNQIIDELKNSLNMDFNKEEVEKIINEKHSKFDTRYCNKENTKLKKMENKKVKVASKLNALKTLIDYYNLQIINRNNTKEIILKAKEKRNNQRN